MMSLLPNWASRCFHHLFSHAASVFEPSLLFREAGTQPLHTFPGALTGLTTRAMGGFRVVAALLAACGVALARALPVNSSPCAPTQVCLGTPDTACSHRDPSPLGAATAPLPLAAKPFSFLFSAQIHVSLTGNPTEMRVTWKTAGSR
jgi:hypothetical protein